jgi:hypothetical protein
MRRRQTAKATIWRQLEAQLNMYRLHTRQLFEEVGLHVEQTLPRFTVDVTEDVDAEANAFAAEFLMPTKTIRP